MGTNQIVLYQPNETMTLEVCVRPSVHIICDTRS